MSAQQVPGRQIKSVVHGTGRMIFRDIQCREVIEIIFDLRALADRKTGSAKDRFNTLQGQRNRMQTSGLLTAPRQAHIDGICSQRVAQRISLESRAMLIERSFQCIAGCIDDLPGSTSLGIRQATKLLQ